MCWSESWTSTLPTREPLILPADRLASRCDPILQPSSRISLTSTSLMRLDNDRTILRSRLHDRHWHFTLVIHANSVEPCNTNYVAVSLLQIPFAHMLTR